MEDIKKQVNQLANMVNEYNKSIQGINTIDEVIEKNNKLQSLVDCLYEQNTDQDKQIKRMVDSKNYKLRSEKLEKKIKNLENKITRLETNIRQLKGISTH